MATNKHVGKKRIGKFPHREGKKTVDKWGVLHVQDDLGERLISPMFNTEKQAREWWVENPDAGN